MRFLAEIAALVLLPTCASSSRPLRYDGPRKTWNWNADEIPILWSFSCDFPEKFKTDVRDGFEYWDSLTSIDLFYETKSCVDDPDETWPGRHMITVVWDSGIVGTTLGLTYRDLDNTMDHVSSAKIRFLKMWFLCEKAQRRSIARHEVGHAIGFHHIPYRDCLMFRFAFPSREPKTVCDVEKEEFSSLYGEERIQIR